MRRIAECVHREQYGSCFCRVAKITERPGFIYRACESSVTVQYMVVRDEKLWFCTNSQKAMYEEMQKSPFVELCGSRLQDDEITTAWIRFSAEVVFADDKTEEARAVKQDIMKKSAIVHELYENNPEHPLFKVFYLKNIRGSFNNLGHVKGLSEKENFSKPVVFEF